MLTRAPIPEHPAPANRSTPDSYVSRAAPLVGVGTHLTVNSFMDQILGAGQ